jgi:hypothetical protein
MHRALCDTEFAGLQFAEFILHMICKFAEIACFSGVVSPIVRAAFRRS